MWPACPPLIYWQQTCAVCILVCLWIDHVLAFVSLCLMAVSLSDQGSSLRSSQHNGLPSGAFGALLQNISMGKIIALISAVSRSRPQTWTQGVWIWFLASSRDSYATFRKLFNLPHCHSQSGFIICLSKIPKSPSQRSEPHPESLFRNTDYKDGPCPKMV